jgi:U3 small nucleolar RNA-associated protein 7
MNAIVCVGHSSGEVTMWTPNTGSTPIVRLLAHASSALTSLSVSKCGTYMATTGKDSRFKIWDIRNTYSCLYDYFTPSPANCSAFSETGLVALGIGN